MNNPNKKMSGIELDNFLILFQEYSISNIKNYLAKYEFMSLYSNWTKLIRSVDELINLPLEIKDATTQKEFLNLSFNFNNKNEIHKFKLVLKKIELQFGNEISTRLLIFAKMNFNLVYNNLRSNEMLLHNFSDVGSIISYYQLKRKYYVTLLDLIEEWAVGDYKFEFTDTLTEFQHIIDSYFQNVTNTYYDILLNNCLANYSIDFRISPPEKSFQYSNLENFYLEPQILTMIDQLNHRFNLTKEVQLEKLPSNKVFSFVEVENNIKVIQSSFSNYNIDKTDQFNEIKILIKKVKPFCKDDYNIIIPKKIFENEIVQYMKKIKLLVKKKDYISASNFVSGFQLVDNNYITSVVLINRFITNRILSYLNKQKKFQIHSGFIFEDMVKEILHENGYELTDIVRIDHKEFDVITIKNNRIYNFQCKNNNIDIGRVQADPKRIARLNNRLINKYIKAYEKEINREQLVKDKLGINEINHFVISRYPVITEIDYIISYNKLEEKIKELNH